MSSILEVFSNIMDSMILRICYDHWFSKTEKNSFSLFSLFVSYWFKFSTAEALKCKKSIYYCLIQFKQFSFKLIFFVLHHLGFKDCRKIFIYQHGTVQVFLITKAFLTLLDLIKSSFLLNLNLGPNSSWQCLFESWSQRGNISFVVKVMNELLLKSGKLKWRKIEF